MSVLLLAVFSRRTASADAPGGSVAEDPAEGSCAAGDCTAQLRFPRSYTASVQLGPPEPPALPEGTAARAVTLADAHAAGRLTAARYLHASAAQNADGKNALGAKFHNFRSYDLEIRWDDGSQEGVYNGAIRAMQRQPILTYHGHAFKFFRVVGGAKTLVARVVMNRSEHLYFIEPDDEAVLGSKQYLAAQEEQAFMRQYLARTGQPWLSRYGRKPPLRTIWPATYVGQRHVVKTSYGYYDGHADGPPPPRSDAGVEIALEVVSVAPRVFLVEDLMSPAECDHIISLGEELVKRSAVGDSDNGFQSDTRTSMNGWIPAKRTPIVERLFDRFSDVLGLDAKRVKDRSIAEELQVVRYTMGQHYAPHHDFGDRSASPDNRFLTLLLYIQPAQAGGGTSFPKAAEGRGLEVTPPRGSGVLFYNMMADGNMDDLALHSGRHVVKGVKWVCNLWVWDAKFKTGGGRSEL